MTTDHWQESLGMLAMSGLLEKSGNDFQNRLPIAWNNWQQKAKDIVGWTVTDVFPNGNLKAEQAILDFWSFDFKKWNIALKTTKSVQYHHKIIILLAIFWVDCHKSPQFHPLPQKP